MSGIIDKDREIERSAPVRPNCFADRLQWVEYLQQAQRGGHRKHLQPFDSNGYRPEFNFCRDCTDGHAERMKARGLCSPGCLREAPKDGK